MRRSSYWRDEGELQLELRWGTLTVARMRDSSSGSNEELLPNSRAEELYLYQRSSIPAVADMRSSSFGSYETFILPINVKFYIIKLLYCKGRKAPHAVLTTVEKMQTNIAYFIHHVSYDLTDYYSLFYKRRPFFKYYYEKNSLIKWNEIETNIFFHPYTQSSYSIYSVDSILHIFTWVILLFFFKDTCWGWMFVAV